MFFVYVLYSINYNKTYVGCTSDLESRLIAHNHHANKGWTKSFMPWKCIYFEEFDTKTDALKREKELKTGKGRAFIKSLIISK